VLKFDTLDHCWSHRQSLEPLAGLQVAVHRYCHPC